MRPLAAAVVAGLALLTAFGHPRVLEAQVGDGCALDLQVGTAVPAGVLADMEPVGWTAGAGLACPGSRSVLVGGRLEATSLDDLLFLGAVGTLGFPIVRGDSGAGLFVVPEIQAGIVSQSTLGLIIPELPPRESLADEVVMTAGAGIRIGLGARGGVPFFLSGRWRVHFNGAEDFQFGDFRQPGFGVLHYFTLGLGAAIGL